DMRVGCIAVHCVLTVVHIAPGFRLLTRGQLPGSDGRTPTMRSARMLLAAATATAALAIGAPGAYAATPAARRAMRAPGAHAATAGDWDHSDSSSSSSPSSSSSSSAKEHSDSGY